VSENRILAALSRL